MRGEDGTASAARASTGRVEDDSGVGWTTDRHGLHAFSGGPHSMAGEPPRAEAGGPVCRAAHGRIGERWPCWSAQLPGIGRIWECRRWRRGKRSAGPESRSRCGEIKLHKRAKLPVGPAARAVVIQPPRRHAADLHSLNHPAADGLTLFMCFAWTTVGPRRAYCL